ncbi:MAG: PEP-CTERM sorting domain-containing protein [Bryobacteraceae bacterium]
MSRASVLCGAVRCVTVVSLLVLIHAVAHATAVNVPLLNVYSTGQGPEGSVDPNYSLVGVLGVYPLDPPQSAFIPFTDGFPFPPWYNYGNLGLDYVKWVAPQNNYHPQGQRGTDPAGEYIYQTGFQVQAGVDPATVVLSGAISSDNCTQEIRLNGVVVSGFSMQPGTCLNQPHYFEIGGPDAEWATLPPGATNVLYLHTTAFGLGPNTIEFKVRNNSDTPPNPTGLAVWLQGEGMWVPEASTAGLALLGLAALALARRKRAA